MWGLYIEPETNKEKKHLNSRDIPCNEAVLSQWIVEWMGYQQTLAQPGVVAVNKDKAPDYWKKVREFFPDNFFDMSVEALAKRKRNFVVSCTEGQPGLLCGSILYSGMAYFGGKSDGELEEIMKQMGFKYVWIKSRSGHPIYNSAPPEPPRERELLSIAPVLQFLCYFAGIQGRGAREESLNRAEARLGNPLPRPMAEFYRCLPGRFYASYNVVRPLSGLKPTKDGRLNFRSTYDVDFIYAQVEVIVQNGKITNIDILEHRQERGKTAEVIADKIVEEQKIDHFLTFLYYHIP